jgi:hypothetical protein
MSAIAAAIVGGAVVSSVVGANAAEDAANTQAAAADRQAAQQKEIFDIQNKQLAPYRGAGYTALNTIGSFLPGQYQQYDAEGKPIGTATGTGYLTKEFTNLDLNQYLAPNYAFQLEQGQGATRNALNATGGLIGGNALKGIQDYTQNFAGNAYQNAFANFQGQRGNIYNTLAGIAGIGQTGQTATNAAVQNYGTNVANLGVGAANAQAAGTVGAANAISGGIQNAGNMFMFNRMLGGGTGLGNVGATGASGGGAYTGGVNLGGFQNPLYIG